MEFDIGKRLRALRLEHGYSQRNSRPAPELQMAPYR